MATACATVGASPSGDAMDLLKRSPNYKEYRFVNGFRAEAPPFIKTLVEWVKGADHTVPDQPVPVVPRKKK